MKFKELDRGVIGIVLGLVVVVGFIAFLGLSLRHARGHCVPSNGVYNNIKVWVAGEIGISGIKCGE
jgi:hypothetical protein